MAQAENIGPALEIAERWHTSRWAAPFALNLLAEHGRYDEAEHYEAAVAAIAPADIGLLECRARRLRNDPQGLLRLSEDVLALLPGASHALYYRAVALAQLGRTAEAAEAMPVNRFLHVSRLETPPGYSDEKSFRAALATEIAANPTLHADPAAHTTRNGLRTRTLPAPADAAASALLVGIRRAIDGYAASLAGEHTFVRARPETASLTAWAIMLRGPGYQQLHHHPRPWLTGVYYATAPDGSPRPGAIRIGVLPTWAGVDPPWGMREIEPEPGTLLLFPSFIPHETVPTNSEAERISVAFDVDAVDRQD